MKLGMIARPMPESFDEAKKYGLSFIEFDCNYVEPGAPARSPDGFGMLAQVDQWKENIARTGVDVGAIGRWGSMIIGADGKIVDSEFDQVKALIDCAAAIGTKNYLVSVNYNDELTLYKNLTASINYLNEVVAYAAKKDITVSIVNCGMGNNYIRQPEMWKIVLPDVPGLKIKYDPSHSFIHGGPNGAYMEEAMNWGDYFGYVHIKGVVQGAAHGSSNMSSMMKLMQLEGVREIMQKQMEENMRSYDNPPAGMDVINWPVFFALLYKSHYDGLLSLEPHSRTWRGELGDKGIQFSIDYIRKFML